MINSVVTRSVPTTVREVRGLLEICSYYYRFVKDLAKVAATLHALTGNMCDSSGTSSARLPLRG